MVDEYQDTNLAQYVIVRQLSIDYPNLAVTGDPDQSIYGWRGASLKNVSYLERDYPQTKVIRLEDNYRSTPEILSVADNLIQNNQFRKPKKLVPSRERRSGANVRLHHGQARSRRYSAADHRSGQCGSAQPAQLCSALSHQRSIASSRTDFGPASDRLSIDRRLSGFLRKEIKDLISYLLVLHNPSDDVASKRTINIQQEESASNRSPSSRS